MISRVLVVDDYDPWRRRVRSVLERAAEWDVIAEVGDGAEATHVAEALKPDLILLDVGLPTLTGIEAAARILARDSTIRILFVSEHRSWEIVEAALATGARGYVLKQDAGRELLPAMATVAGGRRFVGRRLGGRHLEKTKEHTASATRCHEVGFHTDDASVTDEYTRFAETSLTAGNPFIVIANPPRQGEIHRMLRAKGIDVDLAIKDGRYVAIDVADSLRTCIVDGWPDEERVWRNAASLIIRAMRASAREHPRVCACGDGTAILLAQDKADAAVRLEQIWDDIARTYDVAMLCGYSNVPHQTDENSIFRKISAHHSAVHLR